MDSHKNNAGPEPPNATRKFQKAVMKARAAKSRIKAKIWSDKVMQTWDKHPKSKASRRVWMTKNARFRYGLKNFEEAANGEGVSHSEPAESLANTPFESGLNQLDDANTAQDAPTTLVADASSTDSSNASPILPDVPGLPSISINPQTGGPAWRIIRFGPPPKAAAAKPHAAPETVHVANPKSPEKEASTESNPGKENKPAEPVSTAPSRRSPGVMKSPKKSTRKAHPRAGSSGSGVGNASAA